VQHLLNTIGIRLNNCLVEMKPEYDDSITGFNAAWDIIRDVFKEWLAARAAERGEGR